MGGPLAAVHEEAAAAGTAFGHTLGFGQGGGQVLADDLEVPLLGQIPLVPALREGGDHGRPISAADPDSEAAAAIAAIAERIDVELAPSRRRHPELRIT